MSSCTLGPPYKFGDDTALVMNRVNLNPANHFDPLGFFGFVLISLGFTSIAWGKPVPVNFNRLQGDFRRRKIASLVIAGAPRCRMSRWRAALRWSTAGWTVRTGSRLHRDLPDRVHYAQYPAGRVQSDPPATT